MRLSSTGSGGLASLPSVLKDDEIAFCVLPALVVSLSVLACSVRQEPCVSSALPPHYAGRENTILVSCMGRSWRVGHEARTRWHAAQRSAQCL